MIKKTIIYESNLKFMTIMDNLQLRQTISDFSEKPIKTLFFDAENDFPGKTKNFFTPRRIFRKTQKHRYSHFPTTSFNK
jgi:hypothetical protein